MIWEHVCQRVEALRSQLGSFETQGETNLIVMIDQWGKLESSWDDLIGAVEKYFVEERIDQ